MHTPHAFLTALIPTPLTTPAPSPSSTPAATPTVTRPSSYYLKIRVLINHGPNTDKHGLYVSTFRTGAGTADLTVQSFDDASRAFFESGYLEFSLDPTEPFGVVMGLDDDGWNLVSTAPGYRDGGFFFDASGVRYADLEISGIGWGGWLAANHIGGGVISVVLLWVVECWWLIHAVAGLACVWWHGVPQLFWRIAGLKDRLPSSCVRVELLPVGVGG